MKKRKCRTCKQELPIENFKTYIDKRVDKTYVKTDCHTCHKHICRTRHYKERYDISLEQYDELAKKQNGKCKICGTTDPKSAGRFVVDHNHKTGKVRGLLCQPCNAMLGLAKDSTIILQKASMYLLENGSYGVGQDITLEQDVVEADYEVEDEE